jgi:hypothetical protein
LFSYYIFKVNCKFLLFDRDPVTVLSSKINKMLQVLTTKYFKITKYFQVLRNLSESSSIKKDDKKIKDDNKIEFPDVSTCCGRGCANCVWLQYSETLLQHYKDDKISSKKLNEAIEKIDDENLKTFLRFELRDKLKKK